MPDRNTANGDRAPRLLTFGSGGWVLLLMAAVGVVILIVIIPPIVERERRRPPGDGQDPATYGFDLTTCLVSRELVVAAQRHRDLIGTLDDPSVMKVDGLGRGTGGGYLVPTDRVIGVSIAGESRAYPLMLLKLHELVNDTVGGVPILVTYSPLCDSVVVFDRRSARVPRDPADPALPATAPEFGVSGLLYNSNLLMYDRRPVGADESLWSQLQARAVTGPAARAGRRLEILPAALTHWDRWLALHPATTVLVPDPARLRQYRETSYASYFASGDLLFPVDPTVPPAGPSPKTPCVVIFAGATERVYPLPLITDRTGTAGTWSDEIDGETYTFQTARDPDVVTVTRAAAGRPVPATAVYTFWFAWHATHPDAAHEGASNGW